MDLKFDCSYFLFVSTYYSFRLRVGMLQSNQPDAIMPNFMATRRVAVARSEAISISPCWLRRVNVPERVGQHRRVVSVPGISIDPVRGVKLTRYWYVMVCPPKEK